MFEVYILFSPSYNKIYIGYSSNVEQRLLSHNIFAIKGYTLKYRPWELIYREICNSKIEALIREKQLKSAQGRKFAWNIIQEKYNDLDKLKPSPNI